MMWIEIPALVFLAVCLNFLICKMGSWGFCEESANSHSLNLSHDNSDNSLAWFNCVAFANLSQIGNLKTSLG